MKLNSMGQLYGRVVTRNIDFEFTCKLTNSNNPAAPAFEIMTKSKMGTPFKVGVGFEKRTKERTDEQTGQVTGGEPFYSMSIDDPSMAAPLYVTAFGAKEKDRAGEFDIVWQRPRAKEAA
jgi:uncharacterized protein (DUF736 family)